MKRRILIHSLVLFSIVVMVGVPLPALASDEPLDAVEETPTGVAEETEATVDEAVEVVETTTDTEETAGEVEETATQAVGAVEDNTGVAPTTSAATGAVETVTDEGAPAAITAPATELSSANGSAPSSGSTQESRTSSGTTNRSTGSATGADGGDATSSSTTPGGESAGSARPAMKVTHAVALRQPSDGSFGVLQAREPKDPEDLLDTLIDVGHEIDGLEVLGTRIERDTTVSQPQTASESVDVPSGLARTGQALLAFIAVGLCLIALGSLSVSTIDSRATARLFA